MVKEAGDREGCARRESQMPVEGEVMAPLSSRVSGSVRKSWLSPLHRLEALGSWVPRPAATPPPRADLRPLKLRLGAGTPPSKARHRDFPDGGASRRGVWLGNSRGAQAPESWGFPQHQLPQQGQRPKDARRCPLGGEAGGEEGHCPHLQHPVTRSGCAQHLSCSPHLLWPQRLQEQFWGHSPCPVPRTPGTVLSQGHPRVGCFSQKKRFETCRGC